MSVRVTCRVICALRPVRTVKADVLPISGLPCDRDVFWLVRVAVLLGCGLAVTAGPADVELVASTEPSKMTTDDVFQAAEIVGMCLDRQVESVRCAGQFGAAVGKLDPAALVVVGPVASTMATEMRDELLAIARRSIRDYQSFTSTEHRPRLLVSLPLNGDTPHAAAVIGSRSH
jgi:hypothetical protein